MEFPGVLKKEARLLGGSTTLLLLLILLLVLHPSRQCIHYEQLFIVFDVLTCWNKLFGPLVSRRLSNGFYSLLSSRCYGDQFQILFLQCYNKEGLLYITNCSFSSSECFI